jgi:alpha-glucosidase
MLLRWLELAALADAALLAHRGTSLTEPRDDQPQLDDDDDDALVAHIVSLHRALWPYKTTLLRKAQATGAPLVRPIWLHYPDAPGVMLLDRQFMLGSDLLVCPVLTPGDTVPCYIPREPQGWCALADGARLTASQEGTTILCHAPIGKPCAYKRCV